VGLLALGPEPAYPRGAMRQFFTRLGGLLAGVLVTVGAAAQTGSDDAVVARVGPATITRGDLERRMSKIPGIQLATFGANAADIRRNFLEKVMIRDLLMSQSAADKKLPEQPEIRLRLLDALRSSLVAQIRKQSADPKSISSEEVARYYEANLDKFQGPERVMVWRILVASKEEAQKIIDETKKTGSEAKWKETARERSLDKASNERGGDLGFLGPDGHSHEVSVKADAALYAAAAKLHNGEVNPEPVAEGKNWAVVWRRGSQPALKRPLEMEEPTIRGLLARQKLEAALKVATEKLRKDLVSEVTYEGVNLVEITNVGEVSQRHRSDVARHKALGKPQPAAAPGGLR